MKWHATLRLRLITTGYNDRYDAKYGRYLPQERFNVDQSPLPFVIDTKKTYELVERGNKENRYKSVWVNQPGCDLEKRQCTLQIYLGPGKQPRVAIIFRGSGKRITEDEKASWHTDVDIFFQQCAWTDTKFCCE